MKRLRMWSAVAGIALAAFAIRKVGSSEILQQLRWLHIALPILAAAGALKAAVQTRAWQIALHADGIDVAHTRLLRIRLAAQAGGYLAALGPVLSEPAKLALLRDSAAAVKTAPATLMETGTYWLTSVILGLAGTCAAAVLVPGSEVVWVSAGIFALAGAFLVGRGAVLSPVVRIAGARAPAWLRSAEATEVLVRSFRHRQPDVAPRILALEAAAQILTLVEVAAVLYVIGARVSLLHIVAIESAGRLVKIVSAWVPARIGADESGAAASFALLGLSPAAGLTLAVARRLRDLLFCAAGALWAALPQCDRSTVDARTEPISLCVEEL